MGTEEKKGMNQFKIWLMLKRIDQKGLSIKSKLGVTTLHHLINDGKGTQTTISTVAKCLTKDYGYDITEDEISDMIQIIE